MTSGASRQFYHYIALKVGKYVEIKYKLKEEGDNTLLILAVNTSMVKAYGHTFLLIYALFCLFIQSLFICLLLSLLIFSLEIVEFDFNMYIT